MCRKLRSSKQLSERSRKAARDTSRQIINNKRACYQAFVDNKTVRETWVEDTSLQFAGVINVLAREETAIKAANEASESAFDPSNLIFFTHGVSVENKITQAKEKKPTNKHHKKNRLAGAAVIYKRPTANNHNGSWGGRQWELGQCETTSGAEARFVAISKCLTIAAEHLRHAQEQDTKPTITIFTHDLDEINKISRVRYFDSTAEPSDINGVRYINSTTRRSDVAPVLLEIVKKSQKLRDNFGAAIELFCIPQHAAVRGNRLAEAAARKAASNQDLPAATD